MFCLPPPPFPLPHSAPTRVYVARAKVNASRRLHCSSTICNTLPVLNCGCGDVTCSKITASRSFFQCHVIHNTHISSPSPCHVMHDADMNPRCSDVTRLSKLNFQRFRVRLRHIHVKMTPCTFHCFLKLNKTLAGLYREVHITYNKSTNLLQVQPEGRASTPPAE